jgi:hypothetical protein
MDYDWWCMQGIAQLEPASQIVLDHSSAHGATVTHIRGILLANAQNNLKQFGVYESYLELLPSSARGQLEGVIASSWIDIETALAHYATLQEVGAKHDIYHAGVVTTIGAQLASRISQTFLATAAKTARNGGLEAFLFVMRNNDRIWDRIYRGGGTTVLQLAPKEIVLEDRGLRLLECEAFRRGYLAYLKAITSLFCKSAFLNPARARRPGPFTIATRISWV